MLNKGMMSSSKSDWETPNPLFDSLHSEYNFVLDACASEDNKKLAHYYSIEDDGLSMPWDVTTWVNPPYGDNIYPWIERGYKQAKKHKVTVVMLLPARTDTKYFHHWIMNATEIRFIKGRIKFVGGAHSAPFPSLIAVFDQHSGLMAPMIYAANKLGQRVKHGSQE